MRARQALCQMTYTLALEMSFQWVSMTEKGHSLETRLVWKMVLGFWRQ